MGRIKKAAGPKHEATVSPAIAEFVTIATTLPVSRLPKHLKSFPRRWPFPKGDLYHWIHLFNRFDAILDEFIVEYGLHDGPQIRPFGRAVLLQGVAEESKAATVTPTSDSDLDSIGFGQDGDRQMVELILEFSRRLLESCGNRSLYSSSERLSHLLNTTSLSLLTTTLQLAVRLAQRYHASRQRGTNPYQNLNNVLLASHYNIDLEKVQRLANPFIKSPSSIQASITIPAPCLKGKEKAQNSHSGQSTSVSPNDLLALTTQDTKASLNGSAKHFSNADPKGDHASQWEDWGSVLLSYYQPATAPKEDSRQPPTPTPARRPSGLSRQSRLSSSDESPDPSMTVPNIKHDDSGAGGMRHVEIPYSIIASSTVEEVLKDHFDNLPKDSRYELLTRVRSAYAMTKSLATRQELVGIRLLALTNLAYIYPDATFQQKILQQDADEPRRLQLAYQLADLVHPPGDGASAIPYKLQTLALAALEALIKQKTKAPDVIAALNIHVSHGVLFYVLRRAVAEMAIEDSDDESTDLEKEERQEALFSLLETLPAATTRTIESLIASGLLDILVEVLNLRTRTAERSHPKVLTFLNSFIYASRDAMQSLANSRGLEAISDLLDYEVRSSMERAKNGEGLPEGFRTRVIDYQIPYFQQQSLKMVFKLIAHMMTNGTGNLDRLLRNLIDSPQLLSGLKTVIINPRIFGSSVWASAINIMSTFIHNEPTSYAVISEAGLNKGLLESIALESAPEDPMKVYLDFIGETDVFGPGLATSNASRIASFMQDDRSTTRRQASLADSIQGILPSSEAVLAVPQAFGAICLNHSGMQMFLESGALNSFFKLFESNDHIKSMAADRGDLPRILGNSFDELVRHHPTLKMSVMIAIMTMIERLGKYCQASATERGCGAKLWLQGEDGSLVPAGEDDTAETCGARQSPIENDDDVVMGEASPIVEKSKATAMRSEAPLNTAESIEREERNSPNTATRIAVAMNFLSGFFENTSLCSFFIEAGGANYVLDLATMPSLQYDFNIQDASHHLARVVHIMVEQKPHLVLPSLLQRTQNTAENLGPLCSHTGEEGFFSEFTSSERQLPEGYIPVSHASIGTTIVKSLVHVQTLCNILFEVFSSPIFTSRSGHTPFSQVNLADMYKKLIKSLGLLHRVCVWEEILLQKKLPEAWKEATRMKGIGMGSDEADEVLGFLNLDGELSGSSDSPTPNSNGRATGLSMNNGGSSSPGGAASTSTTKDENTAPFKNAKVLRYLLSQVPSIIVLFSQNLGKALTPKRRPEAYARQNAYLVAEAISEASLEQLTYEPPRKATSSKDRYAYWIVALTSVSSLMIDRSPMQVLTLLLQAFKNAGGLDAIKEILNILFEEVKALAGKDLDKLDTDDKARLFSANAGIRIILPFYTQITMAKSIIESNQTNTIGSNERDRGSPHYFSAPQFLVELRMAVLPVIRSIWNSEVVEKAEGPIIKGLIDILRTILEGGEEGGAFKRTDEITAAKNITPKIYTIQSDRIRELKDDGYNEEVAREALYRCMNERHLAREYCQALQTFSVASRCPIPDYDQEKPRESASQTPHRSDSGATLPASNHSHQAGGSNSNLNPLSGITDDMINTLLAARTASAGRTLEAAGGVEPSISTEPLSGAEGADAQGSSSTSRPPPPPAPGVPAETQGEAGEGMAMSIDNLQNSNFSLLPVTPQGQDPMRWTTLAGQLPGGPSPSDPPPNQSEIPQPAHHVTVDDLDEERSAIRQNLIDRALDVVNAHEHVTFELADLINAATTKSPDAKTMRREIGETLVQSLISLQMEDDFRPAGKKIASYANLLALVIQDQKFYEATLDELVGNLEQFLGFIKIFADQPPDEASPWIGQILLVIEKMLAEDVQPSLIQWTISTDGKISEGPIVDIEPSFVPTDAKVKLFEAIVEILPRVGKDESLALSVVRALVILTRNRDLASRLSEKRNIQRLFVMVKQLAGLTTDRLLSTFMLLLRHLVEDEHTIRQIMRSEIMTRFETRRGGQTDTASYVKQMYDLVLRSPQIFVDVTNEKLEIARYEPSQRVNQNLQLKPEVKDESKEPKPTEGNLATSTAEASTGAVEGQLAEAPKPSFIEQDEPTAQKAKANETKAPVVEHPSGVIHFLLLELLNYKDVEDKDPTASAKELLKGLRTTSPADTQDPGDATNGASASNSTTASPANLDASETKKSEKPELKPEQHPMHFYRLFLLQCLAELLHCYNSTKVEFINFSRKADAKAMTPSKPRSGVLNYLLNDVIPVGTLSHEETLAYKKRNLTSNWAMSVIVSLCLRTNEKGYYKKQGSIEEDEESDLLFVRKFVLEHGLKAYKDAHASEEEADVKYARLLDLADLFNRLLQGRIVPPVGTPPPGMEGTFQKSIAKLMFEKNFISALTSSIADIDLNFPASKRAIKYILRPLKQLTSTAVVLSQDSDISTTPGQTDDDEISTATSVSDVDDEREETPDLFRNSTLGMFEPGREEESSSDSSGEDEDMYDEEYDDGMGYDEGLDRDENEVISDEDEELGEAGHMEGLPGDAGMDVEVVIDGDDEDPSDDEDDEDQDDEEDDMDNMDDGDEIEVIDEINGDSENGSLVGGEDDGWQDEDGDDLERYNQEDGFENDLSQDQDAESAVRDIVREFGGAEAALQRLEGLEDGPSDLQMDIDSGRYMEDVVQLDDDDDEEDEEDGGEDDVDDDDVIYQPEYDDEDPGMPEPPFGWDPDDEMSLPRHHHHHHHHHPRRVPDAFYSASFGGGGLDRTPLYRSHRPAGGPRSNDDNVNPLLQRHDRSTSSRSLRGLRSGPSDVAASLNDYWVHGMESARRPRGIMPGESPLSFLNSLIASVDQNGGFGLSAMGGPNGALHLHIAGGPGGGLSLPRELQIALGGTRHTHQDPQHIGRDEHRQPTAFQPAVTYQRWQEEARLLYGNLYSLKAERIVNTILRLLVPPALEKKKREEDDLKRMKEQLRKEEQEAREKAEKEAQEKREQEEREAAAARAMEEAEAAARAQEESREESQAAEVAEDGGAMEGVESAQVEETTAPTEGGEAGETQALGDASAAAGPSEPAERVRTMIRGRELDITGLGIDLAYLDALPEDIREEVLMSQLAIQRSQAQAAGEEPTDISREFLEALPVEIREELLQQEAQDRRRRERDEARRSQQAAGGAPARGAEDMDPASFLASLDPTLRQHVLMDQDEEILAHLPEEIAAEARALGGDRAMHRFAGIPRGGRGSGLVRHLLDGSRQPPATLEKPPRRQTVQMLDKAGVATLLRLMFIPQQGSSRTSLNGILHDVSKNRQNRAEVISLLLSILQDGSADVNAVERSFAHLSLRAKQPATQKTPQTLKRTFTGQMASVANNMEATPLMVIQQCLSALVSLTHYNLSIPWFFLTEHEVSSGIKTKANRKGKGKETRASKYALNALLSLLDRKLIMESSGCMEQLSSLLQSVTHPLLNLLRKEKENVEEKHKESEPIEVATTSPEATHIPSSGTDGQPAEGAVESGEPSTGVSMSPMVDVEADTATEQQEPPAPTTETEAKKEEEKKAADTKASVEEQKKRVRTFTPPVVPEENLRLVVNVLAARECSAKTFRDTLSTINNLSGIPGAKEVFGKGLIEQAQDLGQSILQDLDDLVPQIKQAESGTDIQGMALAKFSPASSDQAKLLRVLTALDYLFDPKRNGGKTKPAAEEGQSGESSTPKEDILTTLYENATFGSLWNKLSECLSSIHQAEGMLNIATILLPLVEALMVVCKNTTLKDIPLIKTAKEFAITSPPPESYMENLFFKFTEDHRKILNELVRQNPKLMSANFALLVKNPKVLEFDNKRNYFTRRLHSRGTEARHTQPPLQLAVRRDTVFLDSFKFLHFKSGDEIKYGKLSIRFNGEEGVDAGGVTREWFQVLSRQMFNPDYALFIPVASDRTTFHPNKLSKVNDEHLMFFKFIGRIIGKALYEGRALDCHFSRAVYKRILGKTVSIKDMETLDLEYYKSLLWMLENDITDIITETFSVETDDFGVTEIVDLKESGRNIPVTEDNKHEYVQLVVEYRLTGSVQEQLSQFLKGFHDIVPPELIAIFNEQELELLISGLPDIDVDDWKNHTEYHNYQVSSPQIQWFWRAVRSFDKEERAKLLQFVTGTSKVPLNGFGQLEGMNGFSRFNIHRDYGNKDRLPSSHTCFNQLDLPEYDSYETLRQQVYTAMTAGSEYFGFA